MPTTSLIPSPMIGAGDVSNAEHAFLNSVTSNIQTQVSAAGGITIVAEQASTSGTTVDFTGIPAGVKEIFVFFDGVSIDGTENPIIQLGDSGGFETSGYLSGTLQVVTSTASVLAQTTGFGVYSGNAGRVYHGFYHLVLFNAANFSWAGSCSMRNNSGVYSAGGGAKDLTAELTQIRITSTNTPDDFDAGSIGLAYR